MKLTLENLTKVFNKGEFNEVVALRDVCLDFESGEYVLIVGHNGSGKSTLLNLIDGRIKSTFGSVFLDGEDISHLPTYKRANYLHRLYQNSLYGVVPMATIQENMALSHNRGKSWKSFRPLLSKSDEVLFSKTIAEFRPELSDQLKKKVYTLSPGERQALILALLQLQRGTKPQILLADEPTASLDPDLAKKCKSVIQDYAREGWLCLVVTHDLNLIRSHTGRTIQLEKGTVFRDNFTSE